MVVMAGVRTTPWLSRATVAEPSRKDPSVLLNVANRTVKVVPSGLEQRFRTRGANTPEKTDVSARFDVTGSESVKAVSEREKSIQPAVQPKSAKCRILVDDLDRRPVSPHRKQQFGAYFYPMRGQSIEQADA